MREDQVQESEIETEQQRRDRVIIASAVAALIGAPATMRRIREVPGHQEGAWTREGRLGVQGSHQMPAALLRTGPDRGVENI